MSAVDVTSPHCGCGCRPVGCEPGCPCPECQPGPGLDLRRKHNARSLRHSDRLKDLLERSVLTMQEERELDRLMNRITF